MSAAKIRLGSDEMRYIALFESITGATANDCLIDPSCDRIIFVAKSGQMGLAIGKAGKNINTLRRMTGRPVEVVEASESVEGLIRNSLAPAKIKQIRVTERPDKKIVVVEVDPRDKAIAIGKKEIARGRRRELGFPAVALAGYTQSGKTTLFNRMASESKRVGLGPFTTLSTFARKVRFGASQTSECILIDSIGFIEDMHPTIVKAFTATLGEIAHSDLILLFVDASEETPVIARRCLSMNKILREIDADGQIIVCANKIDLVDSEELANVVETIRERFVGTAVIPISALTSENLSELFAAITRNISNAKVTARFPSTFVHARNPVRPE